MKTTNSITENIIEGLRKTAIELEKFQVQATLGKAEAKDKVHIAQKKFNIYLHDVKMQLKDAKKIAEKKSKNIKPLLETLELKYALGKADIKELINVQMKKIHKAINDLENHLKK